MKYARETQVPVARSRAEIETLLSRYGADQFVSGWERGEGKEAGRAVIGFRAHGRHLRFELPLPRQDEPEFTEYESYGKIRKRSPEAAEKAWEQAMRQRWRALALVVKAKLEAVDTGITTFEEEFLAHIVLPGKANKTVGDWLLPQIEAAYVHGKMIPLLPEAKP